MFETPWFNIEREFFDDQSLLDGKPFYRLNTLEGVTVVVLTVRHQLIWIKQFRPALRRTTLELPSGYADPLEFPIEAAKRELYEEMGYVFSEYLPCGIGKIMLTWSGFSQHIFLGVDAVRGEDFEPKEMFEVIPTDLAKFRTLVMNGEFQRLSGLGTVTLADWRSNGSIL